MENIYRHPLNAFYNECDDSTKSFNQIRSLESCRWARGWGANTSRSSRSHWSFTRCDFQDHQPFFWKLEIQFEDQEKFVNVQWRSIFNANSSRTPKYECYSSSTTPSLFYWHRSFDSICLKLFPSCRSLSSYTNCTCFDESKAPSSPQKVGNGDRRRNEWRNIIFSNESHLSVHLYNRWIFIWRERGIRNNPAFLQRSVRFGGGRVMVYTGISINLHTDIHIIRSKALTVSDIGLKPILLRPIVVLYAAAIGGDFMLMDNNWRPSCLLCGWFPFRGRNHAKWMAIVFFRHEHK